MWSAIAEKVVEKLGEKALEDSLKPHTEDIKDEKPLVSEEKSDEDTSTAEAEENK